MSPLWWCPRFVQHQYRQQHRRRPLKMSTGVSWLLIYNHDGAGHITMNNTLTRVKLRHCYQWFPVKLGLSPSVFPHRVDVSVGVARMCTCFTCITAARNIRSAVGCKFHWLTSSVFFFLFTRHRTVLHGYCVVSRGLALSVCLLLFVSFYLILFRVISWNCLFNVIVRIYSCIYLDFYCYLFCVIYLLVNWFISIYLFVYLLLLFFCVFTEKFIVLYYEWIPCPLCPF